MNLIQQFFGLIQMALKYGPTATKADRIFTKIQALDSGKLADEVEAIFLSEGIDLAAFIASATGTPPDMVSAIKGLQAALNASLTPSPNLAVDGSYGQQTFDALQRWRAAA